MVIFRGSDGKPGYHQTDDIHDAVGFVERMRNEQNVEQARIFRLEEVVFEYRPYYRVELAPALENSRPTPMQISGQTPAIVLNDPSPSGENAINLQEVEHSEVSGQVGSTA